MATLTLRREDGRVVCERVLVADRVTRRMLGLLGRGKLEPGDGVVLRPAWAIHTHFMRFAIDAVFLDADQVVIRIAPRLAPWKTASCRGAREVVELAAGECSRRGLELGDRVAWASRSRVDVMADKDAAASDEDRSRVLVVTHDARFAKLATFLLDGRGLDAEILPTPDRLSEALVAEDVVAVVLDGADSVGEALRVAGAAQAQHPEIPLVVAADVTAPGPAGIRVFDRWNETEELMSTVQRAIADSGRPGAGGSADEG
jgi:uncharacterized membrane protein (UPF0127 family)